MAVLALGTESQFASRLAALAKAIPSATLEPRYARGELAKLSELARAIATSQPAAIVSDSILATRALFEATATIPIVMARSEDPVGNRLVKSLAQPGGNVTGLVTGSVESLLVSTEALQSVMPAGSAIGVLLNQNNAAYRPARSRVHHIAQQHKRTPVYLDVGSASELPNAFAMLKAEKVGGLVVMDDPLFLDDAASIVKRVAAARVPAVYPDRAYVDAGGLMAYGGDSLVAMTKASAVVERILSGTHPAELAVQVLPAQWSANRATARAQGVRLPQVALAHA